MLNVRGKILERTKNAALDMYEKLKNTAKTLNAFEPMESTPFKLRGKYRYSILIKAKKIKPACNILRKSLNKMKYTGIIHTVDVDP